MHLLPPNLMPPAAGTLGPPRGRTLPRKGSTSTRPSERTDVDLGKCEPWRDRMRNMVRVEETEQARREGSGRSKRVSSCDCGSHGRGWARPSPGTLLLGGLTFSHISPRALARKTAANHRHPCYGTVPHGQSELDLISHILAWYGCKETAKYVLLQYAPRKGRMKPRQVSHQTPRVSHGAVSTRVHRYLDVLT